MRSKQRIKGVVVCCAGTADDRFVSPVSTVTTECASVLLLSAVAVLNAQTPSQGSDQNSPALDEETIGQQTRSRSRLEYADPFRMPNSSCSARFFCQSSLLDMVEQLSGKRHPGDLLQRAAASAGAADRVPEIRRINDRSVSAHFGARLFAACRLTFRAAYLIPCRRNM